MADVSKTVDILFHGTDALSGSLENISTGLDKFQQAVGNVTGPIADLADKLIKIDTVAAGVGATLLGLAIDQAAKFDDSMTEIGTITKLSGDSLSEFGDQIKNYASTSTQSIGDITEAVYQAASFNINYKDSIDFLSQAEELSTAGRAKLSDTTVLLAGSLKAYGASTSEAKDFSDVLFTAVADGHLRLGELANVLGQVTNVAHLAGVPFSDLVGAVAALTSYGVPLEQAIGALKNILSETIHPTDQVRQAAADLHVEFGLTALQTLGLHDYLQQLLGAAQGNIEKFATLVPNIRAMPGATALAADASGNYAKILDDLSHRAGITAEAAAQMAADWSNSFQTLKNNVSLVLIEVGQVLEDQGINVMGEFTNVLRSVRFSLQEGAFDPVFSVLNDFGVRAELFLAGVSEALPAALSKVDWTPLINSLKLLDSAIGGLFGNLDLTKPEDLAAAIQKLIQVGSALITNLSGQIQGWGPWISSMLSAADAVSKLPPPLQSAIGQVLGFTSGLDKALPIVKGFSDVLGGVADLLALKWLAAMAGANTAVSAFGAVLTGIGWTGAAAGAGAVGYALGTAANSFTSWVTGGTDISEMVVAADTGAEGLRYADHRR